MRLALDVMGRRGEGVDPYLVLHGDPPAIHLDLPFCQKICITKVPASGKTRSVLWKELAWSAAVLH